MNNVTIQAAIIAAAVALIVALLSQVVSVINQILAHRLTVRRENQKYYNEVYQKLFAFIIPEVFTYIGMVSNYRRRHDTTEEEEIAVKDNVIKHVSDNLLYASPRLVALYHEIDVARIRDESARNPLPSEIELLFEFVNEYEYVARNTSIYSGNVRRKQLKLISKYKILYALLAYGLDDLLTFSFWFDESQYTQKSYNKLRKMLDKNKQRDYTVRKEIDEERREIREIAEGKSIDKQKEIWDNFVDYREKESLMKADRNRKKLRNSIINLLVKDRTNREDVYGWLRSSGEKENSSPLKDEFTIG